MDAALAELIDDWAHSTDTAGLFFRCPAEDAESRRVAETHGYRLMDLPLVFRRAGTATVAPAPDARLRDATPGDAPALAIIARGAFRHSRFYADPALPDDRCDDLYATWVERSVLEWPDPVLVAHVDGRPAGFVCIATAPDGHLRVTLIAVAPSARRLGLGTALVDGAIAVASAAGAAGLLVTTQAANAEASALYLARGFEVVERSAWYHKWFSAPATGEPTNRQEIH